MFSPRRLFSKYSNPITFFKHTEANAEHIIDLPTPPDTPLYDQPPPQWLPVHSGPEGYLQQSLSCGSAQSLPFRAMRGGDRNNDMVLVQPSSSSASPFRSVSQMKEPFNLILPNSPTLSQSSSRKSKATQSSKNLYPFSQLGLGSQKQSTVKPPITLLPSPTITEMREYPSDERKETPGAVEETPPLRASPETCPSTPVLKDQIPSAPPNLNIFSNDTKIPDLDSSTRRLDSPRFTQSQLPFINDASSFQLASPNLSSRRQSSSKAPSILSSEGDWLAGTLVYPESPSLDRGDCPTLPSPQWTAASKTRQRRCQIVGHSPKSCVDRIARKRRRENTSQLGYATVVSTTDLRLVTIRRTPSTIQTKVVPVSPFHVDHDIPRRPVTPDRILEVSVFSPETPDAVHDSGYSSRRTVRESADSPPERRPKFRMGSLASTANSSLHSAKDPDNEISPGKVIASYFLPATDDKSCDHSRPTPTQSHSSKLHRPPPVEIQKNDGKVAHRCDEYAWILDQLTPWIESFPSLTLQLDTPVIAHIRHQLFHRTVEVRQPSHESSFCHDISCVSSLSDSDSTIDTFRKIFPYTSESIVSALGATLMAQKYLFIFTDISSSPESSVLETIPAKARSTLGIHCSQVTANQRRERLLRRIATKKVEILSDIVDRLLTIICGRADEFMKRMLESIVELMMMSW